MERRGFFKGLLVSSLVLLGFRNAEGIAREDYEWIVSHKVSVFPRGHGTSGMKWVTGFGDGKNVGFEARETGIISNHPNYKAEYHYDPNTTVGWIAYFKKVKT